MPDSSNRETPTIPGVENRAVKPAGILPRNMQAMVIAGISVIMVGAIAFSGNSATKTATKSPVPANATVTDPNQARIAEYRQRLDEQARRLAAEQAQFQQTRQQFSAATGVQPGTPGGATAAYSGADSARNDENSIENDRRRRAYLSLFASNVALSYRKDNQAMAPPQNQNPSGLAAPTTPLMNAAIPSPGGYFIPFGASTNPDHGDRVSSAGHNASLQNGGEAEHTAEMHEDDSSKKNNTPDRFADLNRAEGKPYRLFEGTVIETVLTNRLNGAFAGPVNCMVTTNVYSQDGQQLLIPQGSRALGEVKRVTTFGQERLAVIFHRLIMPDGYSVSLDQFKGLNQIGETGLRDQVNHHYTQIFGVSLAIGAIAGLAQADTRAGGFQSSSDAYRQGVASSLSQSSLRILDRYLNVLPTLTIREGHRVKVYLSDDLLLPAYNHHRMPGDL